MKGRIVRMGEVAGAYGVRGWVRLVVDSCIFAETRYALIGLPGSDSFSRYRIDQFRSHNRCYVAKFEGIDDRDRALTFRGCVLALYYDDLPRLPEREHYWCDLIGSEIRNTEGQILGLVDNLIRGPASDLIEVLNSEGVKFLIPFVERYVVDVREGSIIVDWQVDWN